MMDKRWKIYLLAAALLVITLSGCYSYGPRDRIFTPVPTLIPVTPIDPLERAVSASVVIRCPVRPVDLLGAWVNAGVPETEAFEFDSENGEICTATFAQDIQRVFTESNLWFEGAPACVSCHYSDLQASFQQMDLSSYEGILAGAQRTSPDQPGMDILGGGNWEESRMYYMLINRLMPLGRPADSPEKGPVIFAGTPQDAQQEQE